MIKVKFQETVKDITGQECNFYMVGAENKAGYRRIARKVPECELARVKTEMQAYAKGAELPAGNMRF